MNSRLRKFRGRLFVHDGRWWGMIDQTPTEAVWADVGEVQAVRVSDAIVQYKRAWFYYHADVFGHHDGLVLRMPSGQRPGERR